MRLHFWSFLSVLMLCGLVACTTEGGSGGNTLSKKAGDLTLVIHQLGDADKLNPITSSSANSTYIEGDLFQGLLTIDPKSLQLEGLLATGRPQIQEIEDGQYKGGMSLTYEIRPEATWDNGQPITAADVIFTNKAVLCPIVESSSLKSYVEFIDNIVPDAGNPKRFTIFSKERYLLAETHGTGFVIPQYHYDPKGLLNNFTIAQLKDPAQAKTLTANAQIKQFAEAFNTKFDREKGTIVGSGPYEFVAWETGQNITLRRKANWWGDKVKNVPALDAHAPQIIYKVITDWTPAIASMKDEGLDVAYGINTPDFVELQKNASFKQLFNLHSPTQISYDYIGFNMRNPKLSDKRVRRALAHLIDKQEIIDVLLYGLGETVNSPIHPIKPYYNKNLPDIPYDVEKAKALLPKPAGRIATAMVRWIKKSTDSACR